MFPECRHGVGIGLGPSGGGRGRRAVPFWGLEGPGHGSTPRVVFGRSFVWAHNLKDFFTSTGSGRTRTGTRRRAGAFCFELFAKL
ncbi:MAG: hypothetical protein BJ554DRAFT_6882 [Olpidium bornovanus]|uniref:Uncharacterized protein n=1 Tax=Olpidium bornovanus TaxID=278681 RepID=A0A8H7ZXV9_9FUNG|nr:MAG: hypothetical protein BJ554DRAFT_6882 [Olpidium bornovanus]